MKKIILLFIVSFTSFQLHAQLFVGGVALENLPVGMYISVCPEYNGGFSSCKAAVDYGQGRHTFGHVQKLFYLTDEKGEIRKFRSGVAILNLMIKNGYKVNFLESAHSCNLYYK